jgi:hypothetical protein
MAKMELRSLEEMSIVEKALLAVVFVISVMNLLFIFMAINWLATGSQIAAQFSGQIFSNLIFALVLQGVLIVAVFEWRIIESLEDLKVILGKKKR